MAGRVRPSLSHLVVAAVASSHCVAANYRPADLSKWFAMGEFGDEPLCALYSTAVHDTPAQEHPDTIGISLVWKAGKGAVLSLNGRFSARPDIRLESVDTNDAWDVTLAAPEGGMAARRVVLDSSAIDALVRNTGLGKALAITVSEPGSGAIRHLTSSIYAKIAVPMYRACVEALKAEPIRYEQGPSQRYGQAARDGGCGFSQTFPVTRFSGAVMLWVDDRGAEIRFMRSTLDGGPHGGFKRRNKPDRVDARQLFGEAFELLEQQHYPITAVQFEELAADLSRGATRRVTVTEPDGKEWTLAFGGPMGKPSAAMFEACRTASFPSRLN